MTTTVVVTAHNFPARVTQKDISVVKGPANVTSTVTRTEIVLQDGQSQSFVVSTSRSIEVEERHDDYLDYVQAHKGAKS